MIYGFIASSIGLLVLLFFNLKSQQKNSDLKVMIQKLKSETKAANDKKTKFLATASHDLQQPHQALGLFLASINENTLDMSNLQIINKAKDAHESTSRLLNQLLDISRIDTMQTPSLKVIPLHELTHKIGMKFMPIAESYGVELRIRVRESYGLTDEAMLERMITNILLNAFRHAKHANILLSIRQKTVNNQTHWLVEVYDTGIGIAKHHKERVFQEFIKLDRPEHSPQGLGLGLSIVKRLAHKLNHRIELRSKLGKGSCFSIQIKAEARAQFPPHTKQNREDSVIRERMKVAVIHADIMLLESLQSLLDSWGCATKPFSSSVQALSSIKEQAWKPDALIVDGTLHKTQVNLEQLQDIQTLCSHHMPMILITENLTSTYAKEAQRAGFTLIEDPINPNLLRDLLGNN